MTSLSISLDSLGVGIALPAVGIPLLPLLIMVSITTTAFTFTGLAFGARLGERYEHGAERAAGLILVVLAVLFAIGQVAFLRRFLRSGSRQVAQGLRPGMILSRQLVNSGVW